MADDPKTEQYGTIKSWLIAIGIVLILQTAVIFGSLLQAKQPPAAEKAEVLAPPIKLVHTYLDGVSTATVDGEKIRVVVRFRLALHNKGSETINFTKTEFYPGCFNIRTCDRWLFEAENPSTAEPAPFALAPGEAKAFPVERRFTLSFDEAFDHDKKQQILARELSDRVYGALVFFFANENEINIQPAIGPIGVPVTHQPDEPMELLTVRGSSFSQIIVRQDRGEQRSTRSLYDMQMEIDRENNEQQPGLTGGSSK